MSPTVTCRRACAIVAILQAALWAFPTTAAASHFQLLDADVAALQARIDLIEQAEQEICVAYYAADLGLVPVATMELLRRASCRGVRVRIVIDGLIARIPADLEDYLQRSGIEFRVYHPPFQGRPDWLNRRIHVKCMIVDGQQAILGSRNLIDEHFGLAENNYIDCDAYVAGEVACQAQRYFEWLWDQPDLRNAPTRKPLSEMRVPKDVDPQWRVHLDRVRHGMAYRHLLALSLDELSRRVPLQYGTGTDWRALSVPVAGAGLIHDRFTDKRELRFQEEILSLIRQARNSILIETPYPVFTPALCDALIEARQRGVAVDIVTNSLATTDRLYAYAAYQNDKRRLLAAGVGLYEIAGPRHFHAKSMVIDDHIGTLGSFNFDPRSCRSNLELNLLVCDPLAASMLRDSILGRACGATRIEPDRGPLPVGAEASLLKRAHLQGARLTVTAIRWLL